MASNALHPVPFFGRLSDIYMTEDALQRERSRWDHLSKRFKTQYGQSPAYVVRAPGRVNVLGEHIDYSLFPVLPAAIEQDIIIGVLPSTSTADNITVDLSNVSEIYPGIQFQLPRNQEEQPTGDKIKKIAGWERYVKAVLTECTARLGGQLKKPAADLKVMVSGTVPSGAGLSSSAAFVVGVILAYLVANDLQDAVSRTEIVDLAMASEHRLGLNSGGMDQAASILSSPNSLLHLSFYPALSASNLPLPSSLSLVITNSLAPHALADSAPDRYNLRVVENLCATRILLHALQIDVDVPETSQGGSTGRLWLREALEHWAEAKLLDEAGMYEELLSRLPSILGRDGRGVDGWTKEQMIEESGMSSTDFKATFLEFIPIRAERFHLLKRVQHTLEESLRVCRFKALCESLSSESSSEAVVSELGQLVTESHHSLKDLYEATVPEVDDLQALCMESGSLGSRQTGGGWGGAVISLIPADRAEGFLKNVRSKYAGFKGLSEEELDEAAFVTIPGSGAGIYSLLDSGEIL
ncbi:galactokinase [Kwoniella shandongensis]|uniref:Galactokinase n=1 Tax=Kwoniella shandongensis TaxID=1734106 RepID=A0A5M6BYN3_9TREE|nr:galactokinase [Kwoniella shandongensis]KAA5526069.1 galactokinase [Kwoniella shandongensis]